MAATVVPTLLAETPDDFQAGVQRLSPFVERVHVDFSDGEFAPTFTVGINNMKWPEQWKVDLHAMVARPSQFLAGLIALKPRLIILHAEASEDITDSLKQIKAANILAGVALLKTTVPKSVTPLIELADHVMIFSGNLGEYGGKASMMQLEKVRLIRMIHPEVEIGWDGGASIENAFSLAQGDINAIYAGSAISRADDPEEAYKALTAEINRHSVI